MQQALDHLARTRCSAILRTPHAEAVRPALQAAADGGFEILECTLNTPGALEAIAAFAAHPGLLVGAGTVLSTADASAAVDAGAQFLVAPICDPGVIKWAVERDILIIPGCSTPSEMWQAHQAGAPVVKFFPGPADGPQTLRVIRGPMPFLRIFPTSGVTLENAAAYLEAGAFGLGFVNCLFQPEDLAAGNFAAIQARAAAMVAVAQG